MSLISQEQVRTTHDDPSDRRVPPRMYELLDARSSIAQRLEHTQLLHYDVEDFSTLENRCSRNAFSCVRSNTACSFVVDVKDVLTSTIPLL
ncbi:hypothetical protein HYV70_04365 [Candidatus Uhrbacteria bacterium]|nr:hypothetical protein [Candidatus Uhrbacteria bacterium]